MTYRPWLEGAALRQMAGLPIEALETLVRVLSRICDDPHGQLFSAALGDDPRERMAELGDSGFIEFSVDDDAGLIHVYHLVWTG